MKKNWKRTLFLTAGLFFFCFCESRGAQEAVVVSPQKILVTAATGALGKAIAENLCQNGYSLILAGRDLQKLQLLQEELSKRFSVPLTSLLLDYEDEASLEKAAQTLQPETLRGIVLITPRPFFKEKSLPTSQEWQKVFAQTFIGPLEAIRQLDAKLDFGGSIVLISGLTSKIYMPAYPHTNVVRTAWSGELKNLVWHFAPRQIRVNAVSPGVIQTAHNNQKIADGKLDKNPKTIPLGHYGDPKDVATLVHFLLSAGAAHLNGENIALDGGENTAY